MNRDDLNLLIKSAGEPDETNRQLIAENIINALTIPIEWLVNHTIRAKALAVRCIGEAFNARLNGNKSWIRLLGWAFHYIADWGTPPHSPISKSNPSLPLIGVGTIIGGVLGGFSKRGSSLGEVLKGIMNGAFKGGIVSSIPALIALAIEHSEFEDQCDKRWSKTVNLIKKKFKSSKKIQKSSKQFEQALIIFEKQMDDLRRIANKISMKWIYSSDDFTFADYMTKIALVMDYASQILM